MSYLPRLRSSWEVRTAAGEPYAVVRVRNLQATVYAAQDAWGREGKAQPVLVSAEVSLRNRFEDSSAADRVAADTVHYGTLSKAILASLEQYQQPPAAAEAAALLSDVLETIWLKLTELTPTGHRLSPPDDEKPFLDLSQVAFLSVTVMLPKASLLGSGVSISGSSVFPVGIGAEDSSETIFSKCLGIHGLRVPTLIGVNPNERLAKQIVVVDVEVDKFCTGSDIYTELEAFVVKTMEETSFETLEALGSHLGEKVALDFDHPRVRGDKLHWQLKIRMEKPTAVPFADAPCVEMRMNM